MTTQFLACRRIDKDVVPIDLRNRLGTRVTHRRAIDEVVTRWSGGLSPSFDDRRVDFRIAFGRHLLTRCTAAFCVRHSLFRTRAKLHLVEVFVWTSEGIRFPIQSFFAPTEFDDFNVRRGCGGYWRLRIRERRND